jgi:FtsH-binding integral membrane protein
MNGPSITIDLGLMIGVIGVLVFLGKILIALWSLQRTLETFMVEHNMLMFDYAERKEIKLADLPTRQSWGKR